MEKRRHRRIPFQRSVYLSSRQMGEQEMESSDFSLSGMSMLSEQPVPVGEKVRLRFVVNTLGNRRELNVLAEIRHVNLAAGRYRVGVNFLDLD